MEEFILRVAWSSAPDHRVRRDEVMADVGCAPPNPPPTREEMEQVTFAAKMAMIKCLRKRPKEKLKWERDPDPKRSHGWKSTCGRYRVWREALGARDSGPEWAGERVGEEKWLFDQAGTAAEAKVLCAEDLAQRR